MTAPQRDALASLVAELRQRRRTPAVTQAYRDRFDKFAAWCAENDLCALPTTPEAIVRYLYAHHPDWSAATQALVIASIQGVHEDEAHPSPRTSLVSNYLQAVVRDIGLTRQPRTAPIDPEHLPLLLDAVEAERTSGMSERLPALQGAVVAAAYTHAPLWVQGSRWGGQDIRETSREDITLGGAHDPILLSPPHGERTVLHPQRDAAAHALLFQVLTADLDDPRPLAFPGRHRRYILNALTTLPHRSITLAEADTAVGEGTQLRRLLPGDLLPAVAHSLNPRHRLYLHDTAYLLVGWHLARRHSDLAYMTLENITATREGCTIRQPRSKSDPDGHGVTKFLSHPKAGEACLPLSPCHRLCPVRALTNYVEFERLVSGRVTGPVFTARTQRDSSLSVSSQRKTIQRLWREAGLPAEAAVGTRSLRVGAATAAHQAGASLADIAALTDHVDPANTERYIRRNPVNARNIALEP